MSHSRRGLLNFILGATTVTVFCTAQPAVAQQSQPSATQQSGSDQKREQSAAPSAKDSGSQTANEDQETQREQQTGTSNDRLFWTLPNFLTVANEGKYPPLSVGQKFAVVARSSFDYVEYPWYAFLAGISQAENSEPGYGQGAQGYAKRFGAAFADGTIENFMTSAVLPSVLHQDPRYYQLGKGGFWHRTKYAVTRLFITRSDSGTHVFNFSEVFGSGSAAAISTYSYHPSADRNFSNTASVWGTEVGYDGLTFVVKEFWPDVKRKLRHNSTRD